MGWKVPGTVLFNKGNYVIIFGVVQNGELTPNPVLHMSTSCPGLCHMPCLIIGCGAPVTAQADLMVIAP